MADPLLTRGRQALQHNKVGTSTAPPALLPALGAATIAAATVTAAASPHRVPIISTQVEAAIQLLSAASAQQPHSPDVWFALGTALARKVRAFVWDRFADGAGCNSSQKHAVAARANAMQGCEPASCCMCYLRTSQLLSGASEEQLQVHMCVCGAAVAVVSSW
jgi:hypothetical protein